MLLPKKRDYICVQSCSVCIARTLTSTRYALPSELHPKPFGFHSVLALIITDVELFPFFFPLHLLCVTALVDLELTL